MGLPYVRFFKTNSVAQARFSVYGNPKLLHPTRTSCAGEFDDMVELNLVISVYRCAQWFSDIFAMGVIDSL